ncbi:MAG: response regulator transcription factor [Anaerolineae bacterium]|nr:response regulator transcription factor [Anaerolineae bacterium]
MRTAPPIRVLIVDDHVLFRKGLQLIIKTNPEFLIAGEAGTGYDALRYYETLCPDVMLLDIHLPDISGVNVTRLICQKHAEARILVMTGFYSDDTVHEVMTAGATGFLAKTASPAELLQAIRTVGRGETSLSPETVKALIRNVHSSSKTERILTDREQEVLRLLAQGYSNNRIAEELSISYYTAKKHVSNILAKMNTDNRTKAVSVALQNKMI